MTLRSAHWRLEIAGRLVDLPTSVPSQPSRVVVKGDVQAAVYDRSARALAPLDTAQPTDALFFENTTYDLYLSLATPGAAHLRLPPTGTKRHETSTWAHYSMNFANDVGYADFVVESQASPASVRIEVFPTKLDYRRDYIALRNDVAGITHNLVWTVQARTFGLAAPKPTVRPTATEWLALMRGYFEGLGSAVRAIGRNPHSTIAKQERLVSPDRARRVDGLALQRQLRRARTRREAVDYGGEVRLPQRVTEVARRLSYDTRENRYLKAVVTETRRRLKSILRARASGDDDADLNAEERFFEAARPDAKRMLLSTHRLLGEYFFEEVSVAPPVRPFSFVFHRHPHYAAAARFAALLNGGLSIEGELLAIGVKNLSTLYEYWCFLQIIAILRERLHLEQQSLVRISHLGVVVLLQKGVEAAVRFRDPKTKKTLRVVYNRLFKPLPTTPQKPDNVIELAGEDLLYLFDAKYRLGFDSEYVGQFGGMGPTLDDINTMHRYRDAIVLRSAFDPPSYTRGVVREAIVLFPHHDEPVYRVHPFFASISAVGIGGIPLLPGTTSLLQEHLSRVLVAHGYAAVNESETEATLEA